MMLYDILFHRFRQLILDRPALRNAPPQVCRRDLQLWRRHDEQTLRNAWQARLQLLEALALIAIARAPDGDQARQSRQDSIGPVPRMQLLQAIPAQQEIERYIAAPLLAQDTQRIGQVRRPRALYLHARKREMRIRGYRQF